MFLAASSVAWAACGVNYQEIYNERRGIYECIELTKSQQLKSQVNKRQLQLRQKSVADQLQRQRTQKQLLLRQQRYQQRQNVKLKTKQRQLLESQRIKVVDDVNNERRRQSLRRQKMNRLKALELKKKYDLQRLLGNRETLDTKQAARKLKTLRSIKAQ